MGSGPTIDFVPAGTNSARPFGMDARARACRLASNAGFRCADEVEAGHAALVADMAFAWDPVWLKTMAERPRAVRSQTERLMEATSLL